MLQRYGIRKFEVVAKAQCLCLLWKLHIFAGASFHRLKSIKSTNLVSAIATCGCFINNGEIIVIRNVIFKQDKFFC